MNAQEYNLNIRVGYGFPQTVKISQDDVGRPLSFHLLDGAEALTIPSGATVTIHGTKPSGLGFSETCTVTGSTASIETTLEMSQEFGNCPAELVVAVGDDLIGTANFTLFVERSPHPENTIDGTFDVADSIFARMDDLEDELDEVKEDIEQLDGLSDDIKLALLNLAQKVAYIDDTDGAEVYQTLYDALYPPAELVSISAVYTQSGVIYDTDTLDDLKPNLVVTATYEDSTTAVVTSYTLSGTLTTGTSTITVSYGGLTTTFTVTVTHNDDADWDYIWRYTEGLPPVSDWEWTTSGGSGQIREIVDDGMLVAAKYGTKAQYSLTYAPSQLLTAGGGVAEFNFYIPSDGSVANSVNADYFAGILSNGTNCLRVEFTHPKNTSGSRKVVLRTTESAYDAAAEVIASSWDFDTQYKLRLEADFTNLLGAVYLNDTLLADDIDLSTILLASDGCGMRTEGVTVSSTAKGFVTQSVKIKYGLS